MKFLIAKSFFILGVGAAVLGAFSIQPFTKIYKPFLLWHQNYRLNNPPPANLNCLINLKKEGVDFKTAGNRPNDLQQGCLIDTTTIISHLHIKLTNIAYPPQANYVALSCEFVSSLNHFLKKDLFLITQNYFNSEPTELLHKGGYSCRGQRDLNSIKSEHAFGQALDFAGIKLKNGKTIFVEDDFYSDGIEGKYLKEIAKAACKHFGTNLGPNFNELHKDHFHWSIGFPKVCR